jgi:serine/threonine protein phosphatase PrpC
MSGSHELGDDENFEDIFVQNCGCTANLVLITENTVYVANAGDCRCVLATLSADGKVTSLDLSEDHKPDL